MGISPYSKYYESNPQFISLLSATNGVNFSIYHTLVFALSEIADIAFVALNSNLFYWFLTTGSDCRNLNMREVLGLPLDIEEMPLTIRKDLRKLADLLV